MSVTAKLVPPAPEKPRVVLEMDWQTAELILRMYPPPTLFGAPERFPDWRPHQYEALCASLASTKRVVVHNAPTGFGKELIACMEALMSGRRAVILTSSKPLQTQYSDEWGMLDIRGQNNYPCLATHPGGEFFEEDSAPVMVDEGPCHFGKECSLKSGGCVYYDKLRAAPSESLSVWNYDLWLSINRFSPPHSVRKVPLLVLDEAHAATDRLLSAMAVDVAQWDIRHILKTRSKLPKAEDPVAWSQWAAKYRPTAANMADVAKATGDRVRASKLEAFKRALDGLAAMDVGWMGEERGDHFYFEPIEPARFAEQYLFAGAEKVVMVSATIVPDTPRRLGVAEEDIDYFEYPSSFPVANRPIYYLPTVRMRYGMDAEDTRAMVRQFDRIASSRIWGTRGVNHAVSYVRQQEFRELSEYAPFMLCPKSGEVDAGIAQLRATPPPVILNSPAITTGYNLAGDDARWGVMSKMPYPPTQGNIFKARTEADPRYPLAIAARDTMQATGRIVRGADDWGENFLLDKSFARLIYAERDLLAKWWLEALVRVDGVPQPIRR